MYPPSDSSPVKNYSIKNEKLKYTTKKIEIYNIKSNNIGRTVKGYCIKNKNVIEISISNTTLYAIYKLFTNVI